MNRCTQLDEMLHEHALTTARTLLNLKIIGKSSKSQDRILGFAAIADSRRQGKKLVRTIT